MNSQIVSVSDRGALLYALPVDVNGLGIESLPQGYCVLLEDDGSALLLRESGDVFDEVQRYGAGCSNDGIIFDARMRAGIIKSHSGSPILRY